MDEENKIEAEFGNDNGEDAHVVKIVEMNAPRLAKEAFAYMIPLSFHQVRPES